MGRKKQQVDVELTVTLCQEQNEAQDERWFRAMALLLDDQPVETEVEARPVDELTARLDMVCGL